MAQMQQEISIITSGFKEYFRILEKLTAGSSGAWTGSSYQTGISYIPRTGLAMVHKGEEINPPGQRSYDYSKSYSSKSNIYIQPGAIVINTPKFSDRDAVEMLTKIKRRAAMQGYKFATA